MKGRIWFAAIATAAVMMTAYPAPTRAGDGSLPGLTDFFNGGLFCLPGKEPKCHESTVTRTPVDKCIHGKKEVDNVKIRCEYETVPETRYRYVRRLVCKEIPSSGCKTVCTDKGGTTSITTQQWNDSSKGKADGKKGGATVHCSDCVDQDQSTSCISCDSSKGKTTTKVHYWTCVKEPYTVYHQIKREVAVNQPHYEHVKVPITKYVCDHCNQAGCDGKCGEK